MDRYKINFVCKDTPSMEDRLRGFKKGESYEGRAYNGFYEINTKWGSGSESKLITKKLFDKYFELIEQNHLMQTSA